MRAALALLAFPCVDAALKTYANASTELTNLEHFFDAHLSTGLTALLGARTPVDGDVEVCGAAPAAWTTKKNGVTYACRVLGFERDRPGCVDRLLARMRATAPGDHHTPGCGLFKRGARGRPPP